jgi:hypothetical protein
MHKKLPHSIVKLFEMISIQKREANILTEDGEDFFANGPADTEKGDFRRKRFSDVPTVYYSSKHNPWKQNLYIRSRTPRGSLTNPDPLAAVFLIGSRLICPFEDNSQGRRDIALVNSPMMRENSRLNVVCREEMCSEEGVEVNFVRRNSRR